MRFVPVGLAALLGLAASPAQAEVLTSTDSGFVVRVAARVTASPADAWKALVMPATWWSGQHTFSGDAANLTLDPAPGGCFCETLPPPKAAARGTRPGGVQHLRVIYVDPGKALRLTGALGPLQSEAVQATLTITVKPIEGGSRVLFEYVVGGFMRYRVAEIAPAVDKMLSAQLAALASKLGPLESAPILAPDAEAVAPSRSQVGPQGWSLPPGTGGKAAPLPEAPPAGDLSPETPASVPAEPLAGPDAAPAPRVATKPAPKLAPRPAARRTVRAAASAPGTDPAPDQERSEANAAFDALLGNKGSPSTQ